MNEINLYFLGLDLKFCDFLYFRNKCFYILEINVFGYLDFFKIKFVLLIVVKFFIFGWIY